MAQLQEKRNYHRHCCEGRIALSYTHCDSRQIEVGLINFSEQGVSFFSCRPFLPGTTIVARASKENYQLVSADADCLLRSVGLATIKWCREGTRHGRPTYEMGAVYVMPYWQ